MDFEGAASAPDLARIYVLELDRSAGPVAELLRSGLVRRRRNQAFENRRGVPRCAERLAFYVPRCARHRRAADRPGSLSNARGPTAIGKTAVMAGAGKVAAFYDIAAPVYGIWGALTESRAHRRALALMIECGGRNLLEVAAGTGAELAALAAGASAGYRVGVDLSIAMLKRARSRIRKAGGRALLCRADSRALPFPPGLFDGLLNCYMLDLLPESDIATALGEFQRVLSPAGHLVLVTMGHQKPVVHRVWMALFRHFPLLVGGCRPVNAELRLLASGWVVERRERITQMGFHSDLLLARPPERKS